MERRKCRSQRNRRKSTASNSSALPVKELLTRRFHDLIQESEERWNFALQGAGDGVWDWNLLTNEVFFSSQWKEMLGFRDDEIAASLREWENRVHPDDIGWVMEEIKKHLKSEVSVYSSEHRVKCKDGSHKWILDRGKVVSWTEDGKPLRMVGTHKDITEQKQLEVDLRESRQRYMAIFDQSPIAIMFFDSGGRLEMANKACLEMFHVGDATKLKIQSLFSDPFLPEEQKSLVSKGKTIKIECGYNENFVNLTYPIQNNLRTLKISVTPLEADSNILGYTVQMLDETRRRLEEQEVIQERSKLLSIFENLTQMISVTDPVSREILYANRSTRESFGNSIVGQRCHQVFHNIEASGASHPHSALAASGDEPYRRDVHDESGDRHYRLTSHSIEWVDGREVVLTLVEDITDLMKAKESLVQTQTNFFTFFNTIEDFLFVADLNGNIIDANESVTKRLGYKREELAGKSVLEVHPAERRDEAAKILGDIMQGRASCCPIPLATKNGRQIPVETRVAQGSWNGSPALFGVSKDISELRLSEEKFSKMFHFNSTPMALSTLEDGRFIDVNEAFLTTTGFLREEVIGRTSFELDLVVDIAEREIIQKEAEGKGRVRNAEVRIKTKNGEIRHGLFSAERLYVQDALYLLTAMNDITDLKRLERELREHRDELEQRVSERTIELEKSKEELETQSSSLQEMNIALKVLLQQIAEDKKDLESRFAMNIKKLVLPYVEKIKKGRLDSRQTACVSIIESNLNEIVSPFLHSLGQFGLSPRETQIATLIRDGKSSKEIAEIIGLATAAVDTYRNKIRSKLNLNNKKMNLHTYLQSIK
jgi:PAS domain S-box-containing protein